MGDQGATGACRRHVDATRDGDPGGGTVRLRNLLAGLVAYLG